MPLANLHKGGSLCKMQSSALGRFVMDLQKSTHEKGRAWVNVPRTEGTDSGPMTATDGYDQMKSHALPPLIRTRNRLSFKA